MGSLEMFMIIIKIERCISSESAFPCKFKLRVAVMCIEKVVPKAVPKLGLL